MLAFAFEHRVSNDLFIDDAQALGFLTPRLNDVTAGVAGEYSEAANALKLVLPEGDIDFVVAGPVTRQAAEDSIDVDGRRVTLEPIVQILAKKLLYRSASFKARDVFDLAVALDRAPDAARRALAATRPVHPLLLRRLAALERAEPAILSGEIETTRSGRAYLDGTVDRVRHAVEQCE